MIWTGLLLAAFACLAYATTVGMALHGSQAASIAGGIFIGMWTFWTYALYIGAGRYMFMHPSPRIYRLSAAEAVSSIASYLSESTVMYGEPWSCLECAADAGRLSYELVWADPVVVGKSGHYIKVATRTDYLRRQVRLDVTVREDAPATTFVQLDWDAEAEGSYDSCDQLIKITSRDLTERLGVGARVKVDRPVPVEPPPWTLIASSFALVTFLIYSAWGACAAADREKLSLLSRERAEKESFDQEVSRVRQELSQWREYKRGRGLR